VEELAQGRPAVHPEAAFRKFPFAVRPFDFEAPSLPHTFLGRTRCCFPPPSSSGNVLQRIMRLRSDPLESISPGIAAVLDMRKNELKLCRRNVRTPPAAAICEVASSKEGLRLEKFLGSGGINEKQETQKVFDLVPW